MPRFRRRFSADRKGNPPDRRSRSARGHYGPEGVAALRRLITLVTVLAAALLGGVAATAPAQAKAPGANGQIVFGRYSTALGDFQIFTVNPDGTNEAQVLPGAAECPRWSPGGARILVCVADPGGLVRPATVRPDGSGFRLLENPDRSLNLGCWAWSPNGARLACEGWDDANPNRPAGVFTVRSADGGGLVRVTANANNHDVPGDYSPGGGRISFLRVTDSDSETGTLFVVNAGGSGLHQINLHISGSYSASEPAWSPDGTKIVFRLFLASTGDQHLYTVRPTGSDLRPLADTQGSEEFPDWGSHPLANAKA